MFLISIRFVSSGVVSIAHDSDHLSADDEIVVSTLTLVTHPPSYSTLDNSHFALSQNNNNNNNNNYHHNTSHGRAMEITAAGDSFRFVGQLGGRYDIFELSQPRSSARSSYLLFQASPADSVSLSYNVNLLTSIPFASLFRFSVYATPPSELSNIRSGATFRYYTQLSKLNSQYNITFLSFISDDTEYPIAKYWNLTGLNVSFSVVLENVGHETNDFFRFAGMFAVAYPRCSACNSSRNGFCHSLDDSSSASQCRCRLGRAGKNCGTSICEYPSCGTNSVCSTILDAECLCNKPYFSTNGCTKSSCTNAVVDQMMNGTSVSGEFNCPIYQCPDCENSGVCVASSNNTHHSKGVCSCPSNRDPATNCSTYLCNPKCDHGRCGNYNYCTCDYGWIGSRCDIPCPDCKNSGECITNGTRTTVCRCRRGYDPLTNCSTYLCNPRCVHGKCNSLVTGLACDCDSGWTGSACDLPCKDCHGHGKCSYRKRDAVSSKEEVLCDCEKERFERDPETNCQYYICGIHGALARACYPNELCVITQNSVYPTCVPKCEFFGEKCPDEALDAVITMSWFCFGYQLLTIIIGLLIVRNVKNKRNLKWHIWDLLVSSITLWHIVPLVYCLLRGERGITGLMLTLGSGLTFYIYVFTFGSFFSPLAKTLRDSLKHSEMNSFLNSLYASKPRLTFNVECYHQSHRMTLRNEMHSDGRWHLVSRLETVRSVTHRESILFDYQSWRNLNEKELALIASLPSNTMWRFELEKNFQYRNMDTKNAFDSTKKALGDKHKNCDTFMDLTHQLTIPGFPDHNRPFFVVGEGFRSPCLNRFMHACAILTLMRWPYLMWIESFEKHQLCILKEVNIHDSIENNPIANIDDHSIQQSLDSNRIIVNTVSIEENAKYQLNMNESMKRNPITANEGPSIELPGYSSPSQINQQ